MVKRIVALILILACTSVAWMILSVNMTYRTRERGASMSDAVGGLWGTEQHQVAPAVWTNWETEKRSWPPPKRSWRRSRSRPRWSSDSPASWP